MMGSTACNRDEKHTDGAEQTTGHNKNVCKVKKKMDVV